MAWNRRKTASSEEGAVARRRRGARLRLAREVWALRREMTDAQRMGDVDAEYRLLCLISLKKSELDELNPS
jgi:hypothetical protein